MQPYDDIGELQEAWDFAQRYPTYRACVAEVYLHLACAADHLGPRCQRQLWGVGLGARARTAQFLDRVADQNLIALSDLWGSMGSTCAVSLPSKVIVSWVITLETITFGQLRRSASAAGGA